MRSEMLSAGVRKQKGALLWKWRGSFRQLVLTSLMRSMLSYVVGMYVRLVIIADGVGSWMSDVEQDYVLFAELE